MTKDGVAEFAYTLGYYGYNSPISGDDVGSLPICEEDGNGFYFGTGCSSSGTFTIDRFTDAYCTQYYDTYDTLSNFNYQMKSLKSCYNLYSSRNDESPYNSLASYVINESGSCSEAESEFCKTNDFVKNAGSYSSSVGARTTQKLASGAGGSFTNGLKYGLGSTMLLGSLIMFVGILFTNRKKRRAMMHRKFRQSSSEKSKSRSKSKSSSRKMKKKKKEAPTNGIFA